MSINRTMRETPVKLATPPKTWVAAAGYACLVSSIPVTHVFTPTSQARANYVDRESLNAVVYDALTTPGMQVVVYGESGAGKTTLLRKKLEELKYPVITSRCTKETSYDSLLLDAFDQLEATYVSSTSGSEEQAGRGSLQAAIAVIRAGIEATYKMGTTETQLRVVPPQLTPQKLAQLLGQVGACWVLEDFHKVSDGVRKSISQTLKLFCDAAADYDELRLILVGAVESARLVVAYDKEMRYRIAEIEVPPLTDEELSSIVSNGADLLNIDMTEITDEIVRFSSGLGSVCHRLALDSCREAGVYETADERVGVSSEHLRLAVTRYLETSSDTLRAIFEDAVERKRIRRFDNGRLILQAIAAGGLHGMNHAEILAEIRKGEPDYRPSNLTNYLNRMTAGETAILRQSGMRYRFSEPVYRAYAQFRFHGEVKPQESDQEMSSDLQDIFEALEAGWNQSLKGGRRA